jgi:hypothetical protein
VIRFLIGGLVLACAGSAAIAAGQSTTQSQSMRFEWRSEGPADICGKSCRTWISAVGPITDRTPRDFTAFVKDRDVRGAVVVLDSEGGSVVDTMELGRTLRRLEVTTTIGKTITSIADGRSSISPTASCESMCGFVLLGGLHRYVPPEARVLVHQIWLAKKREKAETASYGADELVLVERDIGSLARYTIEMGGDIELLETALRVPPWEPLYRLSRDEIQRMRLSNIERLFDDDSRSVAASSGLMTSAVTPASLPKN